MRKSFWKRFPRPLKVLILLIGSLVTSSLLYIFIGAPPLSDEQRYRRAEKAHLVGPAEILDIIELDPLYENSYEYMLIADTEDAVIMFLWNTNQHPNESLVYREKMGDVTVYAAPTAIWYELWERRPEIELPILLFDNYPRAVRAELDLTLSADKYDDYTFTKDYALEAQRKNPGYFCFYIQASDYSSSGDDEGAVLASFSSFTSHYEISESIAIRTSIPATVRLYDANNSLIHEETVIIREPSAQAHYERGELPEE